MTPRPRVLSCLLVLTVLHVCTASITRAQGRQPDTTHDSNRVTPPRSQPERARNAPAAGALTGRITSAVDGQPIRTARISAEVTTADVPLRPGDPHEPQTVLTDAEGRYQIRELGAGTWNISVTKTGYVVRSTGSPSSQVKTVRISSGQVTTLDASLVRGGAIAGAVFDEFGDPVAGVSIEALRVRLVDGRRALTVMATDQTDDMGAFRLHSLPPGAFAIAARLRTAAPDESLVSLPTSIPTFYPGTPNVGEASRISLRAGEERSGMTFGITPSSSVRVSGTVVNSSGTPADEAVVELISAADGAVVARPFGNFGLTQGGGRFGILNVAPGSYILSARVDRTDGGEAEIAAFPLTVGTVDAQEITVATRPGGIITGTVAADGGTLPGAVRPEIVARPADGYGSSHRASAAANGSFALTGLAGPHRLGVERLPAGWALQRIEIDGADATDRSLDASPGSRVTVRVVVTNRVARLAGIVAVAGRPLSDTAVLVFPSDASRWRAPSPMIRTARTDANGRFTFEGLLPAEYFVLSLDDLADDELLDAEWLERLRAGATRVVIREGTTSSVTLSGGTLW